MVVEYSYRGGARQGAGRPHLQDVDKKKGYKVYLPLTLYEEITKYGHGDSFSEKVTEALSAEVGRRKTMRSKTVSFIDLFAGLGGVRLGFERAFNSAGFQTECVLTSEIKPHAIKALENNFQHRNLVGDITQVKNEQIPDFDFLLAGFPCQAFSSAGKGHGFLDTRGTLFFEIERILKAKKPYGFILENVEGLVLHDRESNKDKIGRTLTTILLSLKNIGYKVSWKLLDSQYFGIAQSRKRVYIVGTLDDEVSLETFKKRRATFGDIMETGLPTINSPFTQRLFDHYQPEQLFGKSIKDKRGGENNIHSWDIGIKGDVSVEQKEILERLLKERRKKHWADEIGITWMDGMPLTLAQIQTFYSHPDLQEMLNDLVNKGYLAFEHPKEQIKIPVDDGVYKTERRQDPTKPKGYNIIAGKLSFEFSKILNPNSIAPTLVAMDVSTLGVIDGKGLRRISLREGLRLFGYPESYSLHFFDGKEKDRELGFDLLGNTVTIPVITDIAERLVQVYEKSMQDIAVYTA
jgi:DNA (cytosine-5)-methyltransferase 1